MSANKIMNLYTHIAITLKKENEPLYLGEISEVTERHWFVVKKAIQKMIDGGMVEVTLTKTCKEKC